MAAAGLFWPGVAATAGTAASGGSSAAVEVPAGAPFITTEGRIRVVGYNDMRDMLEPLAARFSRAHPDITFEFDLRGTRHAPQALASGASAFAPMGAVFTPNQLADYRRQRAQDPACFRVAHASLDPAALSGPLAVFVHEDNPLDSLTLEQLRSIFAGNVETWGELGLTGLWQGRPIAAYGLRQGTALRHEFSARVMDGQEMAPSVTGFAQSTDVVARVVDDPVGIAFAAAQRGRSGVRIVLLRAKPRDPPVLPTRSTLAEGRYPLDRFLYLCAARPMPDVALEFIRLMLSRGGQSAVAATPQRYIPLSQGDIEVELDRLRQFDLERSSAASNAGDEKQAECVHSNSLQHPGCPSGVGAIWQAGTAQPCRESASAGGP